MNKSEVITLGCRLNKFESEIINGHVEAADLNNTYIINTCAVTCEAVRQARQEIRSLRRKKPDGKIIVTGCAAQIDPHSFSMMPEVDLVLGNEEKLNAENYILDTKQDQVFVSDIMKSTKISGHSISRFRSRTRALIQVQQGCDHRCTFCIIPFGRGNSRSIPPDFLIDQIRNLTRNGHKEFVLTGVDISSYGHDFAEESTLGKMVFCLLDQVPTLERLRLSSLDPAVIDEALISSLAEYPRLMPHLHLSVQSGNDIILKRMKRRHNRRNVADLCDRIRRVRPDIIFGADLIAGFPTETEEMFQDTLKLVDEAGLTYLHVFPYSPRDGTPAVSMPQVPIGLRKERSKRLREKGNLAKTIYFDQLLGSKANVLIEEKGRGYTEHYAPVQISQKLESGSIHRLRITGHNNQILSAELLP